MSAMREFVKVVASLGTAMAFDGSEDVRHDLETRAEAAFERLLAEHGVRGDEG